MKERGTILIACHASFHELIGGAFKIATELSEHLAAGGHRVHYVCGTSEATPENPRIVRGVTVWRYPYPAAKSPHPANAIGHVLGAYRLTRQILRREPVACVNGHSPLQFLGAALAARRRCKRLVYSVHSPFADEIRCGGEKPSGSRRQRVAAAVAKAVDRVNCRLASNIQCFSEFSQSALLGSRGRAVCKKAVVTPGWVDVERFRPVEDVRAVRTRLGPLWPTGLPVFLSVRRLEARMGLESLVRAAGILAGQGFDFRLLIGGTGSMEDTLRRQIGSEGLADKVFLLGRIAADQLPLCYAAADCFVLPTRALECFGLIVLEAYACGTGVIGTPVGAIPQLVAQQGGGWLTAGTDAPDIAQRMAAFLRHELHTDRRKLRAIAEQYRAEVGLEELSRTLLPEAAL